MSHFATGMSWLHHQKQYRDLFGEPVPDWICVYDLPLRLSLLRTALRLQWRMPSQVLIRDEFHNGSYSLWDSTRR